MIRDLLRAFAAGVTGKDPRADVRRGSGYDVWGGAAAVLFAREATRDRDLFRAIYLDTADGDDLTRLVKARYRVDRFAATCGRGSATLARPTAAAGQGTLFRGTRISPGYVVTDEVRVTAAALTTTVPLRAELAGKGSALTVDREGVAFVDDALWDNTWRVTALTCADGTDHEPAAALRARVRRAQLEARRGYAKAMTDACVAAGAAHVALFASTEGELQDDYGLNACYVADAGISAPPALLWACSRALERARVCGADLQVLPMQAAPLVVDATLTLWDDPGQFPLGSIDLAVRTALTEAFARRASAYVVDLDALAGAIGAAHEAIQEVTLTTPAASLGVRSGSPPNLPPVLTRYTLGLEDVRLRFAAPLAST